ncbi:MAG TPA: hypothetical protein VJ826_11975 [Candidatus Polarisedimenticolaceae bacterium]|nr:hypothetical protein [Candidatus Polarisedimenticolaceae bacterium]
MRRLLIFVLVAVVLAAAPASACERCFGANAKSPLVDAAKIGMFLLLGVTLTVQGGFVAFFLHLRKRARKFHEAEIDSEWDELQRRDSKP